MAITDLFYKSGKMKSAGPLAKAVKWTNIQDQMTKLSFKQFKEVIMPVLDMFTGKERQ